MAVKQKQLVIDHTTDQTYGTVLVYLGLGVVIQSPYRSIDCPMTTTKSLPKAI